MSVMIKIAKKIPDAPFKSSTPSKFLQVGSSAHQTTGAASQWTTKNALNDTVLSTTLGRLWTERVEYFGGVRFDKASCLAGLVKIFLKTFLEAVRCKTLGKFGMQQMQVIA